MAGFEQVIIDLIMQNFWFIYSLIINFILLTMLLLLFTRLGPLAPELIKISLGRYRKPAGVLRFTNAQIVSLQVREYSPVIKVDEKEPTSELVHMNREHAFQVGSITPEKKPGFLSRLFGKKQDAKDRLNEIYTDDFIPIDINKRAVTYLFGFPLFVIVEGVNSTINPMKNFSQAEQVRAASIAVEQAMMGNKLIAEDKFRKEIATKSDVRNWALIVGGITVIGLVILLILVYGLTNSFNTFLQFVNDQWKTIEPAVTQIINQTPRLIYDQNKVIP